MARRKRTKETPLSIGATLVAAGLAMLVGPAFFGPSPVFSAMQTGLRVPGWIMLGLGVLLMFVHLIVRSRQTSALSLPGTAVPPSRSSAAQHDRPHHTRAAAATLQDADPLPIHVPCVPPAASQASAIPRATGYEPHRQWSPEVFAAIEWRRFEAVCEKLFGQAGFETRAKSHGPDGGVDIWLHSHNARGPVAVVQCKHWQGKPVPVSAVREFFGVMASHKLQRGTYATSSTFTREALTFARANGINAQDGMGLLKLIGQRTPEQQAALLAVAFEGEYWRPTCPSCGIKLLERAARRTGDPFWGCVNYPRCRYTQSMTRAAKARLTEKRE